MAKKHDDGYWVPEFRSQEELLLAINLNLQELVKFLTAQPESGGNNGYGVWLIAF